MISGINNIQQPLFEPQSYQPKLSSGDALEPSTSFDIEDQAIISSQAKLQNELEKFNAGVGDPVNLALTSVMTKTTVEAEVNVINAKKDAIDTILNLGE